MRTLVGLCLLVISLGVPGCGADNPVEQAIDCRSVCDRYQSCFDADYDTAACRSRCDRVVEERNRSYAADECDTCMDDRSCAGAVFSCSTPCAGIIP